MGNAPVIEHEIHTRGPPIIQPYRRQNPEVRRQEQEQLKEMLEQEIVRPSVAHGLQSVGFSRHNGKKKKKMGL